MTTENIPNLDNHVIDVLTALASEELPQPPAISKDSLLFVVGSGNAFNTGKIIFSDYAAIFANESDYERKFEVAKDKISKSIVISASGGKDSTKIAKYLSENGAKPILLTATHGAPASEFAEETLVFPKIPEPYTYNTATYLSIILAFTCEDISGILNLIDQLKLPENISSCTSFSFIVPDSMENVGEMVQIKFDELFGRALAARVFSEGAANHAKYVIDLKTELVIGVGVDNQKWGRDRLYIRMPEDAGPAAYISVCYSLVGIIQKGKDPYFKDNLDEFVKHVNNSLGWNLSPIIK